MRNITLAALSIAFVGCSMLDPGGAAATQNRTTPEQDRWQALEARLQTRDEALSTTLQEMSRQLNDQHRRVVGLEQQNSQLRADLDTARRNMAQMMTGGVQGGTVPSGSEPQPATPTTPTPAPQRDIAQRIGELVILLQDPDFHGIESIIEELTPQAGRATEFLLEEIRRSPQSIRMAENAEAIIAGFPVEDSRPVLERSLRDRQLRMPAARVAARTADTGLLPALTEQLASTTDQDEQIALSLAVVSCGDERGVPVLIRALRSERIDIRILAHSALRRQFRTDGFGYNPLRSAAENTGPIRQWEQWWDARRTR